MAKGSHSSGAEQGEGSSILRMLLRPVVRFCLRRSILLQEIIETVKSLLVELAEEELVREQSSVTTSAVSVMTGVNRKEVSRLQQQDGANTEVVHPLARIAMQWQQDSRFLTKAGSPRILKEKGGSEFEGLVQAVTKDVAPATILKELERQRVVSISNRGIKLDPDFTFLRATEERGYQHLGEDVDYLYRAAEENILDPQETRNLYIRTRFDNIFLEDIPKIRKWLAVEGMKFHRRAHNYLSKFDQDINPLGNKKAGGKVVLNAFSLTDPAEE